MNSDTDLHHQPDTIQQQPLISKRSNYLWIGFFIPLFIINVMFVAGVWGVSSVSAGGVGLIGLLPLGLFLAIINFIAAFLYNKKQHPQGKAKVISNIVLIATGYLLVSAGIGVYVFLIFWVVNYFLHSPSFR